ncbi:MULTISPECIES: restriction endonuclease subunit S [Acinetobacter]|uniref:restriction endonuclease subunit S n=1 Tax=Acinetobacter TaxID=469 RepID=UPI000C5DA4E1|nr:restriction endonuclease subunit S [Acinetobacter sp.]MBC68594.1 restriction endonuclease subunit S [Acinetobacter sp.]MBT51007.1 restriction endonuclease subunit S [Acinetobacter sp.]
MSFPKMRLDKVCRITMGQAPSGDSYNFDGNGLALIAGAGDFGKETPEPKKYTTAAGKRSEEGEIILCIRATIGDLNWSDKKYCLGRGVAGLFGHKDKLDQKYLWHWLKNIAPLLKLKGKGATFLQVTKEDICSLEIALPPLAEQRRIASILDQADELRQKRQQAIEKLDQLLQATFIDMFGDPVSNPKGWDVKKLENLTTKIGSGSTPKGGDSAYKDEGISLVRSLNIYDGQFSYKNLAFIDQDQADKLKNVILQANDVLLNITGASVARCCLIPNEVLPARVNQHVSILRVKDNLIPEFLEALLISKPMKLHLLKISGAGATREALTKLQLQELEIIVPPLDIQNEFLLKLKSIKCLIDLNLKQLNELDKLFISRVC